MNDERPIDGGPAFPVLIQWDRTHDISGLQMGPSSGWHVGLSLRDYFAAKAVQGLLADPTFRSDKDDYSDFPSHSARTAYEIADAMLAERVKARGGA